MVKPPRVRHSKPQREPVTIDLEAEAVSQVNESAGVAEESAAPTDSSETQAEETAMPETAETPPTEPQVESAAPETSADEPSARTSAFGRNPERPAETPPRIVPPVQAAPRRGGLLAGVAGGVIALLAAGGLNYAGLLPLGGAQSGSDGVGALQAEIAALKDEVAAIKAAPAPGGVEEIRQAVSDVTARLEGYDDILNRVSTDLAALKGAVESGGAGDGAAVQALETRIRAIESSIAALGQGGGEASAAALEALAARIAAIDSAAAAANAAAASADGKASEVAQKLAALEQTVAGLSSAIEAQADQPKVALAIAAAALRAALDRGGTFAAEVETFAAVAPDSPELPALRDIAARGVATRADLIGEMPAAAETMIDAVRVVDPEASYWQQLLESVQSLVTVRPIGAVEGEGVPETVARMEAALKEGDLVRALAEYDALPEAARTAGAAFAGNVRDRLAAEQLVDKALADALKAA